MSGEPGKTLKSKVMKFLLLGTIRFSTDKERAEAELQNKAAKPGTPKIQIPIRGIEYTCTECDKVTFTELYDPWSYSARAFCTHCGSRKDFLPNTINYGLGLAQLCISAEAARKRHTNFMRIQMAVLSYAIFGIPSDLIPQDREGQTLFEVESKYFFLISALMIRD